VDRKGTIRVTENARSTANQPVRQSSTRQWQDERDSGRTDAFRVCPEKGRSWRFRPWRLRPLSGILRPYRADREGQQRVDSGRPTGLGAGKGRQPRGRERRPSSGRRLADSLGAEIARHPRRDEGPPAAGRASFADRAGRGQPRGEPHSQHARHSDGMVAPDAPGTGLDGVHRATAIPDASSASGRYGTGNRLEQMPQRFENEPSTRPSRLAASISSDSSIEHNLR
jgi:hypothetical protein